MLSVNSAIAESDAKAGRPLVQNGSNPRRIAVFCLPVLFLSFAACNSDKRINVNELKEREDQLATAAPVDVRPADMSLTELRPYSIGPGDLLQVTMIGLTEPYQPTMLKARVHSQGQIEMPLVGRIQIGGKTLQQAEETIHQAHVPQFAQQLSVLVELVGADTTTIMVSGATTTRGLIALPSNQRNVLYALAAAGGFESGASGKVRVRPIRPTEGEAVYDLTNINDVRRALTARPLESGDMVVVEGAPTNSIYMTGLVNLPGPIEVPMAAELSVVHAVAAAGGLRDLLEPKEATLVRKLPDGERVRVKLNIASILSGDEPDVALRAGDILDIPHTADTRVREWALANLRLGPFTAGVAYDPLAQYNVNRAIRAETSGGGDGIGSSIRQTLQFGIPNAILENTLTPTP